MSIHKTTSGRYEVRWREGTKQRSRTFDHRKDANQFETEVRRIRQFGGVVPKRIGGVTLGAFSAEWFASKTDLAPKTAHEYVATIDRHIHPFLGHLPLTQLRPRLLDSWQRARLDAGAGREAIAKAIKLLGQILDRAVALELLARNPARTLQPPRHSPRPVTPATPEEVEAIRLWFLKRGRLGDATLVSVLAYVGPRPMEALALSWADIDRGRLTVKRALSDGTFKETKTRKIRVVEIPEPVVVDLVEWRIASGRPQGLIWPRRGDGPWRQADWNNWRRRWFKKAAAKTGREDLIPYHLRHSAASLFLTCGRPLTEVAHQVGNSPEVCARTYQHLMEAARGRPQRPVDEWILEARRQIDRVSTAVNP